MQERSFIKKHWSTVAMLAIVVLLIIPQTSMPIKVAINRLFAMSPSTIEVSDATVLKDYDWTLINLEGTDKNLKQSKGSPVFVNLWATWCPPCVAEMPSLQALYDDYGQKVDFYFVTSEAPEKIAAFMKQHNYTFPVYIKKFKAPELLDENSLPTTFVIDSDGLLRIKKTGAANWNSEKVRGLLDQLSSTRLSFFAPNSPLPPGQLITYQGYR